NDVEDGIIYLRSMHSKNGKPYEVPIAGDLVALIERRKQARAIETPKGIILANLVFHRNGKPVAEFRKSWATACKLAGCPGRIFHDLRRCAARNLIRAGVHTSVAMKVTGHATVSMFERYNIVDKDDLRRAMEAVASTHGKKVVAISK